MRLNVGIITNKHSETKKFYCEILDFGITFENEFYLLFHTPNKKDELAFLLPNHPSQNPLFHKEFNGQGIFLTFELDNVDELYARIKSKGIKIEVEIKDEPWGDRHFTICDPNGIAIDFVKYQKPSE